MDVISPLSKLQRPRDFLTNACVCSFSVVYSGTSVPEGSE
jgi:hypothetical protein